MIYCHKIHARARGFTTTISGVALARPKCLVVMHVCIIIARCYIILLYRCLLFIALHSEQVIISGVKVFISGDYIKSLYWREQEHNRVL